MSAGGLFAEYAPERCSEPGHVPGCPGRAGGDHELAGLPCAECGHDIDRHHPNGGGRFDHCHGVTPPAVQLEPCPCDGFAIDRRTTL